MADSIGVSCTAAAAISAKAPASMVQAEVSSGLESWTRRRQPMM